MEIGRENVLTEAQEKKSRKGVPPAASESPDPWLLYIHDKRGVKHSFYKISQDKQIVRNIHCMRGKIVRASSHGWLFLHNVSSLYCCLFNPVSLHKIQLPFLQHFNYNVCLLSSPPTDPNCTVLFISNSKRRDLDTVTFKFCRPHINGASDGWIEEHLNLNGISIEHAISIDGKIHGIDQVGAVFVFEVVGIATISLRRIPMEYSIPLSLVPEYDNTKKILVESCGSLYVVRLILWDDKDPLFIQDLEVFKMKPSKGVDDKLVWEKVNNIGDERAFFISSNCATSCSVKGTRIAGNTIYFTLKKDTSLYTFNLHDKSISVSLPCPNVKLYWTEPTWVSA